MLALFDAVRKAVSCVATDSINIARHDALTTAIEVIKQGRAIFWTQLACSCALLDRLSPSIDMAQPVQAA